MVALDDCCKSFQMTPTMVLEDIVVSLWLVAHIDYRYRWWLFQTIVSNNGSSSSSSSSSRMVVKDRCNFSSTWPKEWQF